MAIAQKETDEVATVGKFYDFMNLRIYDFTTFTDEWVNLTPSKNIIPRGKKVGPIDGCVALQRMG